MASRYTIQLPDGRKLTVEADDEGAALKGAQEWFASQGQAAPAEQQGPPAPARAELTRAQYEAQPWYRKAATAVDDTARLALNGASVGFMDKAAAGINSILPGGKSYDEEIAVQRQATQDARDRAGLAGTAAEVVGGVGTGVGMANAGLTAVRAVPQALSGGKRLAALIGAGVVDGAALGALSGAGNTDDGKYAERMQDQATTGGMFGGVAPVIASGVGKATEAFRSKPVIPTAEELASRAGEAYKRADDAGVIFSKDATSGLRDRVQSTFTDRGFHPELQPRANVLFKEIERIAGQPVTMKGLEQTRRIANEAYEPMNKSSNALANSVKSEIDNLMMNPGAGDVITGSSSGPAALKEARGLYAQSSKASDVTRAVDKAELRAASTGSGGNADNATRQNLRRILENPRGYTPDEIGALETAVRGTPMQNAMRLVGKMSPEGNGLIGMAHGVGALASGGMTLPLMAVGAGAKRIADRATDKNVEKLLEIIRAGGSRSATEGAPSAIERLAKSKRDAIARAMMSGSIPLTVDTATR